MEEYTLLRQIADSWGLLVMFVFFIGIIAWAFRPGSRSEHDNAASIPLRNEDAPAPRTGDGPARKEEARNPQ